MYVGALYSLTSGSVLRIDITTTAAEDANLKGGLMATGEAIPQGCALYVLKKTDVAAPRLDDIAAFAAQKDGLTLARAPRCAVVNALNVVEAVVIADPAFYAPQARTVVPHATADVGWIYSPITRTIAAPTAASPVSE